MKACYLEYFARLGALAQEKTILAISSAVLLRGTMTFSFAIFSFWLWKKKSWETCHFLSGIASTNHALFFCNLFFLALEKEKLKTLGTQQIRTPYATKRMNNVTLL